MSQVNPMDYRNKACPHCKSKKLSPVGVYRMNKSQWQVTDIAQLNRTGFLCGNCGRYVHLHQKIMIYDRAEMKRDVKKLQNFLDGGK